MPTKTKVRYPVAFEAFAPDHPGEDSAVDAVTARVDADDMWDYDPAEMQDLHLAAFNERLAEYRERVPKLGQRADELGVETVESYEDVVPLLFSATTYKSYPESFVAKGRWPQLLKWLDALSADRLTGVDVSGVTDIDEFIERIEAAGHRVVTTSGTSGKCSLIPESPRDAERVGELMTLTYGTMWGIDPSKTHPLYYTGHRKSPHRGAMVRDAMQKAFAPDGVNVLFEETLSVAEISQTAALSSALSKGTATPSDIAALREGQQIAEARSAAAIDRFVDLLKLHPDEPVFLWGQPYVFYLTMQRAQERGEKITFHPESSIIMPGGLKGHDVAPGYEEQLRTFYNMKTTTGYGSADIHGGYVECEHGRWHAPPTTMMLIVDESGERVLNPKSGQVEGVLASFDFSPVGRWGGFVSSDWVVADFSPCACGRRSPSLLSCRRYEGPVGDPDKLNCQGRIEMYIRGVIDEPAG